MEYLRKMKGRTKSPPGVSLTEVGWSWIGAFIGISLVGLLHACLFEGKDLTLIVGSSGASAVLLFGAVRSPLAQPRNLLGGHIFSAAIGVASYNALHAHMWLAASVAVATAIAVMHVTKTIHPPGGATALIAVIGGQGIHEVGYWYVLVPAGLGAVILLIVALLVNNIPRGRRYPEFWF